MKGNRQIVYDALMRVLHEGAYSNLALGRALARAQLNKEQAGFVSALFYGVLETGIQLDYLIGAYLKKPVSSLDREILIILRIGFYQLLYLNSVPDGAAVDESVRLAAYAKKTSAKGLVNAVLRSFVRDGKRLALPERTGDGLAYLSVRYACPVWILRQWRDQYGEETAERLAEASLGRPSLTARVNPLKTTPEKLAGYLENRGVKAALHPWLENCLTLEDTGNIDRLPQYRQGLFHVQDVSSQLSALALGARPGETVMDVCAAPGSKSFVAAQEMEDTGRVLSFDLYEQRAGLIAKGAKRLGISIVEPSVRDGRTYDPALPAADRVLCDAPCSGLGIIRRKPEIKYKPEGDLADLPELQWEILQTAARYVKPGGRLVYSTCTTNRAENEEVAGRLLSQNFQALPLQSIGIFSKIDGMDQTGTGLTLFPHRMDGDGFYIAAFQKKEG